MRGGGRVGAGGGAGWVGEVGRWGGGEVGTSVTRVPESYVFEPPSTAWRCEKRLEVRSIYVSSLLWEGMHARYRNGHTSNRVFRTAKQC